MEGNCAACGQWGVMDRAHIKSKGSGGTWEESNIILLCRNHHIEQHKRGWREFVMKFPHVGKVLKDKGWKFIKEFGRSKLTR